MDHMTGDQPQPRTADWLEYFACAGYPDVTPGDCSARLLTNDAEETSSIGNHLQGSDMTSQRGPSGAREGQSGLGVTARRYLPNVEVALGIQGGDVLRQARSGQLAVGHHGLEIRFLAACQVAADPQPRQRRERIIKQ